MGFIQSSSGKRAKSESAETIERPCSRQRAASTASGMRLALRCRSRTSRPRISRCPWPGWGTQEFLASSHDSTTDHASLGRRGLAMARGLVTIRRKPVSDGQGSATRLGPLNAPSNHSFDAWWNGPSSSTAYSKMLASTSTWAHRASGPSRRSMASATLLTSIRSPSEWVCCTNGAGSTSTSSPRRTKWLTASETPMPVSRRTCATALAVSSSNSTVVLMHQI